MKLTRFEVGKPFPMSVPQREGAVMEMTESGPIVFIQMPGLSSDG